MRILFDQGTPAPLGRHLSGHLCSTASEMGWAELSDRELMAAADTQFDLLITTDKNIRHQQNLSSLRIAVLVLPTTSWPVIQRNVSVVVAAVDRISARGYYEISF